MKTEIQNCVDVLKKEGTILYPTDTIWGIGCDATSQKAVAKIYKLKKRVESKSLIILLADMEDISNYVKTIPDIAWDLMKNVDRPLTIIYPNAQNLAKNVIAEDHSIAIRIVKNEFCISLIREFGKPIVSSSANISGEPAPLVFKCVSKEILDHVDYVVKMYQEVLQEVKPSRIIKLKENGEFLIIRQ
ncbi:MAG: L-threonylcarbamoyladenylate synthase [Bacteroidetes bacterium]|nr:L-threonylcarbamoyladenylate synthase [Bacteroidota bacterium]